MADGSIVIFPCGCTVSRKGPGPLEVTGVGVCKKHLSLFDLTLNRLSKDVAAEAISSGKPMTLDPAKMSRSLERGLVSEAMEGGPVDGSA